MNFKLSRLLIPILLENRSSLEQILRFKMLDIGSLWNLADVCMELIISSLRTLCFYLIGQIEMLVSNLRDRIGNCLGKNCVCASDVNRQNLKALLDNYYTRLGNDLWGKADELD